MSGPTVCLTLLGFLYSIAPAIAVADDDNVTARQQKERNSALFRGATSDDLQKLKHGESIDLGLRAQWEMARRSLIASDSPERSRESLSRFLGFVEGRLLISLPSEWERYVSQITYDDGNISVPYFADGPYFKSAAGILALRGTEITKVPGHRKITVDSQSLLVPDSVFDQSKHSIDAISAACSSSTCVAALHALHSAPYHIVCTDSARDSIKWTAAVWAAGGLWDHTGVGYHYVFVELSERLVIVFGIANDCAYIEAFNADDGTNIFRFSTSY